MPTRSDSQWTAHPARPPRSVFGNYHPATGAAKHDESHVPHKSHESLEDVPTIPVSLQSAIDTAIARSFLYRFLAHAYQDPTENDWAQLVEMGQSRSFISAVSTLQTSSSRLAASAASLIGQIKADSFERFLSDYLTAFGHAARGSCPLNEIEYGDLKADPLFQPHRLADLAAFYRAFGLAVTEDADERQDHICLELEFMCVLAAKEAYALERQLDVEELSICRSAQTRFLREHLGRWTPAFTRRLERLAGGSPLGALAEFTRFFIEVECVRLAILPGSEDLLLRPVDAGSESLCQSCGPLIPSAPLVS